MTLQEKVGQYVEANQMTMGTFADKLGISRSSLFNKMRGSNEFSLSEAFSMSRILGMSLDEFYQLAVAQPYC